MEGEVGSRLYVRKFNLRNCWKKNVSDKIGIEFCTIICGS
jgi:hypothetical protein